MSDGRKEVFVVHEFDTNALRVFATEEWALAFATAEKGYAEDKCGLLMEMGADDEAVEAEELMEGGFVEPAEWIGYDDVDAESYAKLLVFGKAGAHWSEF